MTPFSHFQISTLQSFQFPPLRHLKSVDLSSNFLTSLDRMTFVALGNRQFNLREELQFHMTICLSKGFASCEYRLVQLFSFAPWLYSASRLLGPQM